MSYASSSTEADTDQTMSPSPMLVSIPFPKRREASRKRKRQSDDGLYKKIRNLENEKGKLQRKSKSLRRKISRSSKKKENSSTLYLVSYGKPKRGREIVNKAFV